MIVTLASYGCDVNARDSIGNSALHIAVTKGYHDIARLLLCLGADQNAVNAHGESARHLCAKMNE